MAATMLSDLFEKYKKFVESNAETLGHIESTARVASYLAPGLTATVSELLSSIVSLVVLVHDSILRNAGNIPSNFRGIQKMIATALTVIDHVEVFLEMAAYGGGQNSRRWLVVACVQVAKAILHFILLLRYNSGITPSPPVPALKRNKDLYARIKNYRPKNVENVDFEAGESFTLQSTGRSVRSLYGSVSAGESARETGGSIRIPEPIMPTALNSQELVAECLHILRPIIHLISLYFCGASSWKPWLIACGVDTSSLLLMGDAKRFNVQEQEELKRRSVLMLLYLLRSPFYDRFSKERLLFFLGILAHNVPVVRIIAKPLLEYLPIWQQIYFYVWTV